MGCVILLSGGYDSALIAATHNCDFALWVDYGQQSRQQELLAARTLARQLGIELRTVHAPLQMSGDRVSDPVVPARNAVLLSLAANMTEAGDTILIGCNANDHDLFPDCRPDFLRAMGAALSRQVVAPLMYVSKKQILKQLGDLGVDCWTCYLPRDGAPCGHCVACRTVEAAR